MPALTINFNYKKIVIIGLIIIALLGLAAFFIYYYVFLPRSASLNEVPLAIDDQQPIWLLRDGQVSVFRQTEFYKDEVVSRVVIDNLGGQKQADVKVYEVIPKEIAQSASELEFSASVTVVEDDPIILWDLGDLTSSQEPVELRYTHKERLTVCGVWEKIEPGFKEQMKKNNLDPNSEEDCGNYAHRMVQANKAKRQQQQQAAQQKAAELQEKKEKITKVVQPGSNEYVKIAGEAKVAIAKEEKKKEDKEKERQKKSAQTGYSGSIYYGNNVLPEKIHEKILLREASFLESGGVCAVSLKPKEVLRGSYGEANDPNNSNLFVEVARYNSAEDAQKALKNCQIPLRDILKIFNVVKGDISYDEMQGIDKYYPYRLAYEKEMGQAAAGLAAVENYTVVVWANGSWLHNQEFYRKVITDVKYKMFGLDKRLAVSSTTPTPSASPSATATPTPAAPTPSATKTPTPTPSKAKTPTPTPTNPVCGFIDMLNDYKLYTYTLNTSAKCSGYKNSSSARSMSLRCSGSAASWRNYWVKEIEVAGLNKVRIKADLGLNDYSRFFTECGGTGVKYDNYSSLIVLSTDPRSSLNAECNIACASADWPKCAVKTSGSGFLAQCGVAKCSASKKCDFEVSTNGLNKIYLVYHVSDAWMADIEGKISNLEVCSSN